MTNESSGSKDRLLFIDGLRGIAASMVMLTHLTVRTPTQVATRGYLGVAIFFVLSGFVIAMSIGARNIDLRYLLRFAARRSIRLDPPYWVSIAVAIFLGLVASTMGVAKVLPSPSGVVLHMSYLQDIVGIEPISSVYWTLCLEVQFYLFLVLLLWFGQACGHRLGTALFSALLVALTLLSLSEHAALFNLPPQGLFLPYWYAFSLGALTHWTITRRIHVTAWLAAVGLALAFSPLEHGDWNIVASVTALANYLAASLHKMSVWLADSASQFLGRISYSLYLFHPTIGWSAQSLALRYLDEWGSMLVGVVASLASAYLAYRLIERPSMTASRWIKLSPSRRTDEPRSSPAVIP